MTWIGDLWADFTTWWATIDWGTAPEWVGAILTSGSLLLAVLVLRTEFRRSRMAEIKKVVSRYRIFTTDDSPKLEITAYNANDHPIAIVTFLYWGGLIWHRKFLKNPANTPDLPPTAEGTVTIPWTLHDYPHDRTALICITDTNGNAWYRGLETGRIYSPRRARIWLQRGRWPRLKDRVRLQWLRLRPGAEEAT
jgi:hypothetical protein